MAVECDSIIREILKDESLTRGLGDVEARILIEWVVDWAELLSEAAPCEQQARKLVTRLGRRARAIGRFVQLWCSPDSVGRASACQLAASERFTWPFPNRPVEPADLMDHILEWETEHQVE